RGAASLSGYQGGLAGATWDHGVGHHQPVGAWRSGGPVKTPNAVSNSTRGGPRSSGPKPATLRASVVSTEASASPLPRVASVGPTRASVDSTAPNPRLGREDPRTLDFRIRLVPQEMKQT